MHLLLEARVLAPDIKLFRIHAPRVARKRQAGQFVILRVHENGERIPITIADSDAERGDIVTGAATVILAMGAGRTAAASIHDYLTTGVWETAPEEPTTQAARA